MKKMEPPSSYKLPHLCASSSHGHALVTPVGCCLQNPISGGRISALRRSPPDGFSVTSRMRAGASLSILVGTGRRVATAGLVVLAPARRRWWCLKILQIKIERFRDKMLDGGQKM